jgi:hypothetical protein
LLDEILTEGISFNDFEVGHYFPRIGRRRFLLNAGRMKRGVAKLDWIRLAMSDVTERME